MGNQEPDSAAISDAAWEKLAARRLERGINLSHWFSQVYPSHGYTKDHLAGFITAADLDQIASLGFDHVRLPVDPEPLLDPNQPGRIVSGDFLHALESALAKILARDLAVIVDMHPESAFKVKLQTSDDAVTAFAAFWETLARRLAREHPPERMLLEPLNEPEFENPARWQEVQARLVAAIRRGAPRHTVIACGAQWSGLQNLLATEPLADPNVLYNLHYYEPALFTHQGATWGWPTWAKVRNVPYPSTPEAVAPLAGKLDDEEARRAIEHYGRERWNADRLSTEIDRAARWANERGVALLVNEFGVHAPVAPAGDRAVYLADIRSVFENRGIAWTMWDYVGRFGLMTADNNGNRRPNPAIAEALGLSTGQPE